MSIRIYQMKGRSIFVDQARYATFIVAKYLDTATVNASTKFYNTTFPPDMILTKYDTSTSTRYIFEFNTSLPSHRHRILSVVVKILLILNGIKKGTNIPIRINLPLVFILLFIFMLVT